MAQGTEAAELSAPGTKAPRPPELRNPLAVATVSRTCGNALVKFTSTGSLSKTEIQRSQGQSGNR